MMHEIQTLLSLAAALIPVASTAWFIGDISTRIVTRWQMARKQPYLVQATASPRAVVPIPLKTLPALLSPETEAGPIATSASLPQKPLPVEHIHALTIPDTSYQSMSLVQLRKIARRRGVQAIGDSRKRQAWIDALEQ